MEKKLKVALVHDQLNQAGGAERVLYAMMQLFPQAPVFTLIYNDKRLKGFERAKVKPSFIQKLPFSRSHFKWYLPLMPLAVEELNLDGYDLVISSSSALIKGIITGPQTKHICYCHTPTRWLWSESVEYGKSAEIPTFVRYILPFFLNKMRLWDQLASQRVDHYIANSNFIAQRIKNYYHRSSEVIYPPVDTENFYTSPILGNYFLMVGRLRPYKKFDLAIKAFNKLKLPLKIAGTGPFEKHLRKMAGPTIEFVGDVDEKTKRELFSKCQAFINPQVEDFGITAVEALASGRPVIAYAAGGALEQITPGVNGELFEDQSWQSLIDCILRFEVNKFDSQAIKAGAEKYNWKNFNQQLLKLIEEVSTI